MTDYYIEILNSEDDLYDEESPRPSPSVLVKQYNDGANKRCYLFSGILGDWSGSPSATVLVAFTRDTGLQEGQSYDINDDIVGTPTYPVASNYWTYVRPLGNEAGKATGPLRTLRWQGQPERRYVEGTTSSNLSEYPNTNAPFNLKITREDYGSTALPWDSGTTYNTGDFATSGGMWRSLQDNNINNTPFGGSAYWEFINQTGPWGWRVDMLSADPSRDITARAIGVYSDPEATSYLFTTGAFVNDGNGNYFTECPAGNRTANADPIYFALLLGAAQEGIFALEAPEEGAEAQALFWAADMS